MFQSHDDISFSIHSVCTVYFLAGYSFNPGIHPMRLLATQLKKIHWIAIAGNLTLAADLILSLDKCRSLCSMVLSSIICNPQKKDCTECNYVPEGWSCLPELPLNRFLIFFFFLFRYRHFHLILSVSLYFIHSNTAQILFCMW